MEKVRIGLYKCDMAVTSGLLERSLRSTSVTLCQKAALQ